ncbi:MAG: hypothetical protein NZL95_04410 [Chitinophagales bacterium]|nr:hypothetical protein [Chitinophagales bacterium]MDW8427774.1 hypothetical protein [Chitinophagales bacterium]
MSKVWLHPLVLFCAGGLVGIVFGLLTQSFYPYLLIGIGTGLVAAALRRLFSKPNSQKPLVPEARAAGKSEWQ